MSFRNNTIALIIALACSASFPVASEEQDSAREDKARKARQAMMESWKNEGVQVEEPVKQKVEKPKQTKAKNTENVDKEDLNSPFTKLFIVSVLGIFGIRIFSSWVKKKINEDS